MGFGYVMKGLNCVQMLLETFAFVVKVRGESVCVGG